LLPNLYQKGGPYAARGKERSRNGAEMGTWNELVSNGYQSLVSGSDINFEKLVLK